MKLNRDVLAIDAPTVASQLTTLLRNYGHISRVHRAVVGMSGGVDSSVTVALAARAFGKDNVTGLALPEDETFSPKDVEDASQFASQRGISFLTVNVTGILEAFSQNTPLYDKNATIANGNLKARIRMCTLYYFANISSALVVGTSNRTEILTGYFTKYGDGASDVIPLGGLYKNQVIALAEYLKVPSHIIRKRPTAGLWKDQYDEDELGIKYEHLDLILYGLERCMAPQDISNDLGISIDIVRKIKQRCLENEHKRRGPVNLS